MPSSLEFDDEEEAAGNTRAIAAVCEVSKYRAWAFTYAIIDWAESYASCDQVVLPINFNPRLSN